MKLDEVFPPNSGRLVHMNLSKYWYNSNYTKVLALMQSDKEFYPYSNKNVAEALEDAPDAFYKRYAAHIADGAYNPQESLIATSYMREYLCLYWYPLAEYSIEYLATIEDEL